MHRSEDDAGSSVEQTGRGRRVGRVAGVGRVGGVAGICAVSALWVSLLLGASVVWPVLEGYDEPQHADMAYVYSSHPFTFYGPGELGQTAASVAAQGTMPGFPPRRSLALVQILPRAERPSLADLGGATILPTSTVAPNQMVQHPPLAYWLDAVVLRAPGVSRLSWDLQLWLLRLVGVVLMSPVPWLVWSSARRPVGSRPVGSSPEEPGDGRVVSLLPLVAACVPLTIPNLVRVGSSVTNDTLLIASSSVLFWALVKVLTGDRRLRTASWVGAMLTVALLTKGFALVLPPVVLLVYLVGGRRVDGPARPVWQPLLVAAVGAVVGGAWWVRNLLLFGTVQPSGTGRAFDVKVFGPVTGGGELSPFVPAFVTAFSRRLWDGIGLPDQPSTGPFLTWGWFTLAVIGIVAALTLRGAPGDRRRLGALLVALPLTVGVVASGSLAAHRLWPAIVPGAQGRYVYHLVVPVAVAVAVGLLRLIRPAAVLALPTAIVVGALVTQATAWLLVLQAWYSPTTGQPLVHALASLTSLVRWSPLPPAVTVAFTVVLPAVTGLVSVAVCVVLARRARSGEARTPVAVAPNGAA